MQDSITEIEDLDFTQSLTTNEEFSKIFESTVANGIWPSALPPGDSVYCHGCKHDQEL